MRRAITYARQSKVREDESQGSPEAQRSQTRAFIEARGWEFVEHFEDLGASGYDPKAARPGLDAALKAITEGRAEVLVVYRLDRLTRRGVAEALRIVEVLGENNASLVSASESFLDTTNAMGKGIFGLFAAMAEQESENISNRSKAAKTALREAGSHSGGPTPFGFTSKRVVQGKLTLRTLVPDAREADVVREVVERAVAGESVKSLVRDLNARGLRPRSAANWSTSTLTRVLRAPQVAGYMPAKRPGRNVEVPKDERGRIRLQEDADGAPLQPWTPLVDPAVWHRLQDVLDARPIVRGSTKEASPLGGTPLLVCGRCGGGLGADRRKGTTGGNYRCMRHRRSGPTACAGTTVSIIPTEDYIARAVFSRLATLEPETNPQDAELLLTVADRFNAKAEDGETAAERRALEFLIGSSRAALNRLDDDRAAGIFEGRTGTERYRRQVKTLTGRLEEAQQSLEALPSPNLDLTAWLDSLSVSDYGPLGEGSQWSFWSLSQRREFLALALDKVEVLETTSRLRGGVGSFDGAKRLRLYWAKSHNDEEGIA